MNVSEFLSITSAIVPEREAIVFGNQRITYFELQDRVNRLAKACESAWFSLQPWVSIITVGKERRLITEFMTLYGTMR